MPTLPPIPQDTWDEHVTTQTDKAVSDGFAALDSARAAQDQARQAEQIATAREQEESAQSAQAQLTAVLQPARDAQATAVGAQQAQDQLDSILAPARAAQQQASQAGGALPPATAGPPQSTGAGIRTQSLDGSIDPGSTDWRAYAAEAAQKAGIDPALFQRQIQQESGFDPNAHSGAGAQGIAQIVPSAHPGVDPMNPKAALDYAANWMRQLTDRYGGDARKALAAYNAGPGAVDTYGGVPPFEETQRYVKTIYDDAQAGAGWRTRAAARSGTGGVERCPAARARADRGGRPVRAGAAGEEASAICGPVAALAFAQANGRNPDLAEVRALAKQVGWTSTGGMNGVANEQALLTKMGVKSRLDTNPDFGHIAQDAAVGNPVIISTPVHYYYASDYDPSTGKVFVGKTGTSRRAAGRG
jgi:soluble lytic murein transglycosylase-like protein